MGDASDDRLPGFLAVDRALGITGAWDVFHKFKWEVAQYRQLSRVNHSLDEEDRIPLRHPMYAAINTATTAWSLVEWVWREAQADERVLKRLGAIVGGEAVKTPRQLKEAMREVEEIEACYQIAHQAKHGDMRIPNENFRTIVRMWYPKGPDGQAGWRQVGYVVWEGGDTVKEYSVDSLFSRVLQYWDRMLDQLQISERIIVIATVD